MPLNHFNSKNPRHIEVHPNKGVKVSRKKNGFNYKVVEPIKKKGSKGKLNVLRFGVGYDTRAAAQRAAIKHNHELIESLDIWVFDKLGFIRNIGTKVATPRIKQ